MQMEIYVLNNLNVTFEVRCGYWSKAYTFKTKGFREFVHASL